MNILNLTQHVATPEQIERGVIEPNPSLKEIIQRLLTFETLKAVESMEFRAGQLARIAVIEEVDAAMIGGAPFFMSTLEKALREGGIIPLYSFSRRNSVEETLPDGSIRKVTVFKHIQFIQP